MGIDLAATGSKRFASMSVLLVSVLGLGIVGATGAAGAQHATRATTAASSLSLNETMQATRAGPPGHAFNEKGQVSGTLAGSVAAHVETIASTSGQATITLYLSKGTISGRAPTHGHIIGPIAYFEGSMSITGGTGSYAHASGSGLKFKGTINRQNFRVAAQLHGTVRL
jgi:hypothetical protein